MGIVRLIINFATICCVIEVTLGALSFTKSPNVVKGLIEPMQLTCTFEATQDAIPISLSIGKGTITILAEINQPDKTKITFNSAGYSVDGKLSNNGKSYITLTWQRPSTLEGGKYVCAAKVRDASGNITPLKSTIDVGIQQPTFVDLVSFSRKQGDHLEEQGASIRDLSKQVKEMQDLLKSTSSEIADTRSKITALVPKVEEGSVLCGHSDSYTYLEPNNKPCLPFRERSHYVAFQTPYAKAPAITLAASYLDFDKNANTRVYFYKRNISEKGFEIVCGAWCDSVVYEQKISWQARNN